MPIFRPLSDTSLINDANLTHYYTMNGNSNDSKGSSNGTDSGVTYEAGMFSSGATYNGSANTTLSAPDAMTTFSFSFWIKTTQEGNDLYIYHQTPNSDNANFDITLSTGGYPHIYNYDGANVRELTATVSVNDGNWHHIVITRSGATNKFYIDGQPNATSSNMLTYTVGNDNAKIGSHVANVYYMIGMIDDFAVFSDVLTDAEVANIYSIADAPTGATESSYLGQINSAGAGKTNILLHFDGNIIDTSGRNVNGTPANITYVAGKVGPKGASFNGTSSAINLGQSTMPTLTTFTISMWIKTTSTGTRFIYTQSPSSDNANFDIFLEGGTIIAEFYNGSTVPTVSSTISVNDGKWHNIIFTRTGATGKLYIDGNPNASSTSLHTITIGNYNALIGKHPVGVYWYSGALEEFILSNYVWTPEQVRRYYTYALGRMAL